ncbi:MOSC domain-containing protein [Microlunatus parietis]|uniref:MOSC domain-containing protein YiiM n=1 Tax=Microlunatus parietis TaxID=682979 RepID=A0A7Y9IDZ3_9ACTN|nr:MOSC domain-containing protein [Microlunatus parietis]NYE75020.1 MOSC domain-containing protein YiiM [Microlunatus parietis]
MTNPAGHLVAVNVVHEIRPGPTRETAIDKRPVAGRVTVSQLGLDGDRQCDTRHHGGPDKALYAYAHEDAAWWATVLGRNIPPGLFGENLRTAGLDVTHAKIGECWRIGDPGRGVLVEVRMPRTPCENLSARMGDPQFHKRFAATRRVGAYLMVLETGSIQEGDAIVIMERPDHDLTIGDYLSRPDAAQLRRLLDSGVDLAETVRRRARRIVARAASPR